MEKKRTLFTDSLHEMRNPRSLTGLAMLIGIAVVLGFYSLQLTDYIKISFADIANELAGMMYGPVAGSLMGGLADLVKYLVRPTGPFFPGFTISGIAGGLIYGCVLYKRPFSVRRIIAANALTTVFVNILLNTYWLTLLYGNSYLALLPVRVIKQAVMFPIEVVMFCAVVKVLMKARMLAGTARTADR